MLFNSYIFVLLFLPLCLSGNYILGHHFNANINKIFLLTMSLWFYGYFNPAYLILIIVSILVNYSVYKGIMYCRGSFPALKCFLLIVGLLFNLGMLFYYKYFDFLLKNINFLFRENFPLQNLILPLGISFFSFQQISFVIDTYKGEVENYSFFDYAMFVTYFPQLIAGPIVLHKELIPQFREVGKRQISWENLSKGLYQFVGGLAKKVLVADTFGKVVNWGFSDITLLDSTNAVLVMLSYTFQIYFDFSGYCDMASGIGSMMNIELPINFNSPYKAVSIVDFWNRWHITLTRFFTKYVYIPLGGNQKGEGRMYINIFIVFFISGLWHGANWTFILWGGLHGIFMIITRWYQKKGKKINKVIGRGITFLFINLSWIVFRANSVSDAGKFYTKIFQFNWNGVNSKILSSFQFDTLQLILGKLFHIAIPEIVILILLALLFIVTFWIVMYTENLGTKAKNFSPNSKNLWSTVILAVLSILSFSEVSTFLYFNF